MANPYHHLYHQRYAEVSYTEGSMEGMELARKHFATALKLNPDNVRALYGLCWVSGWDYTTGALSNYNTISVYDRCATPSTVVAVRRI